MYCHYIISKWFITSDKVCCLSARRITSAQLHQTQFVPQLINLRLKLTER